VVVAERIASSFSCPLVKPASGKTRVKQSDAAALEVSRNRRLSRDFERCATTAAAFIRLAMSALCSDDLPQTFRHESDPCYSAGLEFELSGVALERPL
jgi:hypothetical protein